MAATGIPIAIPALASSGTIASSYKVYSYVPDSSGAPTATARALYTDAQCATPASNPATLGASTRKLYKKVSEGVVVVIKSADDATTYDTIHYPSDVLSDVSALTIEDAISVVATLAALQAVSTTAVINGQTLLMQGRTTAGDRGGGLFRRVTGDQSALVVASTKTVSAVSTGSDTLTATAHGFVSGQGVIATTADAGLSLNTVYYVNRIDANTVSLHTTMVLAIAGTSKVDITALSGALSLKSLYDPKQAVYVIATGDDLDGSDGVWVRDYATEAVATWWGIDPTGATDATEALNGFLFYMMMLGGEGVIPNGSYATTSKLVWDESLMSSDTDITRASIRGESDGSTHIVCGHAGRGIQYSGGASSGLGVYGKFSSIRLRGSGQAGGVGFWIDNAAWFHIEDVTITEFERGIDATDILSTVIDACRIRFNYMGYRFAYSDASRPNAITLRDVIVGSNYTYGGNVTGVASLNISGGSIEGNGQTAGTPTTGGYGLKVTDSGVEGGAGLVMNGVYCEGNADKADVWIVHTTGDVMHMISGNGFGRISSGYYVTNNILFERSGGSSRVWVGGCGFVTLGTYAENAARRYIDGPALGIEDAGNFYQSTTAYPAASDTRGPYCGAFDDTGASISMPKDWTVANAGTGLVTVTHNLGTTNYAVVATTIEAASERVERITKATNSFTVVTTTSAEALANSAANFLVQLY